MSASKVISNGDDNNDAATIEDNTTTTTATKNDAVVGEDADSSSSSIMIFRSSLVQKCASSTLRLPANYVGIRRVRPSNLNILNNNNSNNKNTNTIDDTNPQLASSQNKNANNVIKFVTIDEHGVERRMTKAEKKIKKQQLAQRKKDTKKRLRDQKTNAVTTTTTTDVSSTLSNGKNNNDNQESSIACPDRAAEVVVPTSSSPPTSSTASYHQLPLNPTAMEQELAELRGERNGLPPVILSPPMALQYQQQFQQQKKEDQDAGAAIIIYDHALTEEWSQRLKTERIQPAETIRSQEDLRPLAYQLNPEPWQRMRYPTSSSGDENSCNDNGDKKNNDNSNVEEKPISTTIRRVDAAAAVGAKIDDNHEENQQTEAKATTIISIPKSRDWAPMRCRPPLFLDSPSSKSTTTTTTKPFGLHHDHILSIIFEYIYKETPYYVSCGAKFGADFLIYDGPREERHAFAGLLVLSNHIDHWTTTSTTTSIAKTTDPLKQKLPLPTAYSLTGYVRCLNTAGKLALIATVMPTVEIDNCEEDSTSSSSEINETTATTYRVLIVDVALEKVLDAPTHKRKRGGSSASKNQQKTKGYDKKSCQEIVYSACVCFVVLGCNPNRPGHNY